MARKDVMNKHERTHIGEKQYVCCFCARTHTGEKNLLHVIFVTTAKLSHEFFCKLNRYLCSIFLAPFNAEIIASSSEGGLISHYVMSVTTKSL